MTAKHDLLCPVVFSLATAILAVALGGRWLQQQEKLPQPTVSASTPVALIEEPLTQEPLKCSARERFEHAQELAKGGHAALPGLRERWEQGEDRQVIADALAMIGSGEAVLELLTKIATEPDPDERQQLAESLRNVTEPDGLDTLLSATAATQHPEILAQAIEAAGRMATPESVEFLTSLYRADPTILGQHRKVTAALSQIRNPEAARVMASLARSASEPGLVEAAAHSLAKIGTTTALRGLMDTLDAVGTDNPPLRHSLLLMLTRVQNPSNQAYRDTLLADDELPADVLTALNNQTLHPIR